MTVVDINKNFLYNPVRQAFWEVDGTLSFLLLLYGSERSLVTSVSKMSIQSEDLPEMGVINVGENMPE